MCFQDHADIVGSIANSEGYGVLLGGFNQLHNLQKAHPISISTTVNVPLWRWHIYFTHTSFTCAFCRGAMRQQSTALQLRQISRKISL